MSPPGNLYISTIVRMRASDPPAPTLALVAAVALHETLSQFCAPAQAGALNDNAANAPASAGAQNLRLKWPNDILAGEAKLAGILLERAGDAVVIGFGANLAHHPDSLERPVTSIAALNGSTPDPGDAASALAAQFAVWLARWRSKGLEPIRRAWLASAHPEGTRLTTPDGEGAFAGLDESGALRLRLPDGAIRLVHAGDVFLLS